MNYRIKEICKEQGITLSELADRIDMKSANLSASLSEKGNPTIATLTKIADALNVGFIELFTTSDKEDLTALIDHRGQLYKANTLAELEKIIESIKSNKE